MPEGPLRELRWATLDAPARATLLARQTGRIFDPAVREGVLEIIQDVRAHGDEAIVRAMARYDGCEVDAGTLRVGEEEVLFGDGVGVGAGDVDRNRLAFHVEE